MNKERIQLAEAMGWELVTHYGTERWIKPGSLGFTGYLELPFDPFTDATDCEALIRFMLDVEKINYCTRCDTRTGSTVVIDQQAWEGDDWKQGVCELALKVLA